MMTKGRITSGIIAPTTVPADARCDRDAARNPAAMRIAADVSVDTVERVVNSAVGTSQSNAVRPIIATSSNIAGAALLLKKKLST